MAEIIFWPAVMSPPPPPSPCAWLAVTPAMLPVSSSTQNLLGFCPVLIALRTDAMSSAAPRIGPLGQSDPRRIEGVPGVEKFGGSIGRCAGKWRSWAVALFGRGRLLKLTIDKKNRGGGPRARVGDAVVRDFR